MVGRSSNDQGWLQGLQVPGVDSASLVGTARFWDGYGMFRDLGQYWPTGGWGLVPGHLAVPPGCLGVGLGGSQGWSAALVSGVLSLHHWLLGLGSPKTGAACSWPDKLSALIG